MNTLPQKLDNISNALSECNTDFERIQIRDQAQAVKVAAEVLGRQDIVVKASHLISDAERAIAKANPPKQGQRNDINFELPEPEVIPKHTISNIRKTHSKLSDGEYENLKVQSEERQMPLTRQTIKNGFATAGRHSNLTGNFEWYTPFEIIEAARLVMGGIDLDPASSSIANENVNASTYYTIEDDGLRKKWNGRVWMNPPYSADLVKQFISKVVSPEVEQAIVLINNCTDTNWAHELFRHASSICFPKRIKFLDQNFESKGSPTQGQMIVGVRTDGNKFNEHFSQFGTVFHANL